MSELVQTMTPEHQNTQDFHRIHMEFHNKYPERFSGKMKAQRSHNVESFNISRANSFPKVFELETVFFSYFRRSQRLRSSAPAVRGSADDAHLLWERLPQVHPCLRHRRSQVKYRTKRTRLNLEKGRKHFFVLLVMKINTIMTESKGILVRNRDDCI